MQVDTIDQGPADLTEIARDDRARAAAFAGCIAVEATRAGVQISTATSMKVECRLGN
jgi:hypothetical protein